MNKGFIFDSTLFLLNIGMSFVHTYLQTTNEKKREKSLFFGLESSSINMPLRLIVFEILVFPKNLIW